MSQPSIKSHRDDAIVAVRQLSKRYKDGTEALKGITFNIKKGELFGLIGPDGAGKTTALRILSGVMEPTGGDALVLGNPAREARRLIGYVPQNCALYPDLTIEEN